MSKENPTEQPNQSTLNFETDEKGFVDFGLVSKNLMGKQTQYGSRYLGDEVWIKDGYPNLAEGLRIIGNADDYHNIKIHQDDIEEFVKRYKKHQEKDWTN